jgi:hypothetical protein
MTDDAKSERIKNLLLGLAEFGVDNAVVIFELPTRDGIRPHFIRTGSPLACLGLTEWAATYQHEEAYEGLEITIYDEEDED